MATDVKIEAIRPDQLHDVWDFVKRGLERIVTKAKPDWLPEDAYAQVAHGKAVLYLIKKVGALVPVEFPLGFTIAYMQPRNFGSKKDLCLWCGWSLPVKEMLALGVSQAETMTIEHQLFDYMKNVAKETKADSIVYYSPRPGMRKRAEQWGFKPALVRYDLEMA